MAGRLEAAAAGCGADPDLDPDLEGRSVVSVMIGQEQLRVDADG